MKISSLFAVVFTILVVSGIFFWEQRENRCIVSSSMGDWRFEIARTRDEHIRGLMNRTSLCDSCGMLFIFDTEKPQAFWMKDTYLPLDIYFYNSRGHLVDVAQNMRPEVETRDPMIFKSHPAQYVVEVPAGSLFPGDAIDILQCK